MCDFCKNLDCQKHLIPQRYSMDIDNLCQVLTTGNIDSSDENCCYDDVNCSDCDGCAEGNESFSLNVYGNRIAVSYLFKAKGLIIDRSSETLAINFCPWCGRQLSDKIIGFDKCLLGKKPAPIDN